MVLFWEFSHCKFHI